MTPISEAVILIAGEGSRLRQGYGQARLRGADKYCLKPFVPVLGRPLLSYTLDAVSCAGITTAHFVVGYESERVIAQAKQLIPPHITASFIVNRDWQKQNGISLLAAAGHVTGPFLLTMGDHVFDETIIDCLLENFEPGLLNIAIDRKVHSIVDLDDAMKVQTRENKVTGIGKNLRNYDAIDTGLFVCPLEIFVYLEQAKSKNGGSDCSLANGVELMAFDGKVRGIDIGTARWHDIDTPRILEHVEQDASWRVQRSPN
jgi:choline kinase